MIGPSRLRLDSFLPPDYLAEALRSDVARGLTSSPKVLPPKWFYDERGSALFEEITRLPEYYPTRAEREILHDRAAEIAALTGASVLVELGSGSAEKTRTLLTALAAAGSLRRYVPVDVSESALRESGQALVEEYPTLTVHAVLADFESQLEVLSQLLPAGERWLTAFLGGTIGNFAGEPRRRLLRRIRASAAQSDWLLLGTDLVKDPAVLVPAYADAGGVTAEFNRNVLHVINRELKADFDVDAFGHVALWDAEHEWIEMRLRALRPQQVNIAALDLGISFTAGEDLRTEISAKFRSERVSAELAAAGFAVRSSWTDRAGRFRLTLAAAV